MNEFIAVLPTATACRARRWWCGLALLGTALGGGALAAPPGPAPDQQSACQALRSEYREALPQAQVCEPKAAASTCAASRPLALEDACHCQVSVNPARTQQLDRLLAEYKALDCPPAPLFCNRLCPKPDAHCGGAAAQAPRCGAR